jgi:hypothetical protein
LRNAETSPLKEFGAAKSKKDLQTRGKNIKGFLEKK